ncbi:sugar kinase [Tsuneonella sp. HG222]
MARIVCCGEGMLELARAEDGWALGYGGDTLNTAIHLARAGHQVRFLSAIGSDPFSEQLRAQWTAEGLDLSLLASHPSRHAGLYAITTDAQGERSFTYWRETSAARDLFRLFQPKDLASAIGAVDLFCFSLISLAILSPDDRMQLLNLVGDLRAQGCRIAFDGNYRPRLWESPSAARSAHKAAIELSDIGLPTLDDERQLWGAQDAQSVTAFWAGLGCGEVIVKLGADGCLLPNGSSLAPAAVVEPVDSSGAGDAFNGGYLGARAIGESVEDAAAAGHRLAGWCVMQRGAIPRSPDREA